MFYKKLLLAIIILLILSILTFKYFLDLDNCSERIGVSIDYSLFRNKVNVKGLTYCEILNQSLNGDTKFIKIFATLDFSTLDESSMHSILLIELIDKINENKFARVLSSCNTREKKLIESYIIQGFNDTSNLNYKYKSIKEVFPTIYKEIKNI